MTVGVQLKQTDYFKIYLPWLASAAVARSLFSWCLATKRSIGTITKQFRMEFDKIIAFFIYIQNVHGFFNLNQPQYSMAVPNPWPAYFSGRKFWVSLLLFCFLDLCNKHE